MTSPSDKPRGFAKMKADGRHADVKAIASKGGKAAHVAGTAHEFTSEEAKAAGRKGGERSQARRRAALDTPIPFVPTESHVPRIDAEFDPPLPKRDDPHE